MNLEELARKAAEGDRASLEQLMEAIQDRIYNMSLRMLWHPEDAEDATQEILLRVFTHLGTFRGESSFLTWALRVATNYLLTTRKRRMERVDLTFESFAEDLDRGLLESSASVPPEAESALLVEEIKIGCTHAMLLCLDRLHRIAYILGEILEFSSEEGASILEITSDAFRKRLSRARHSISEFMNRKCGLVNDGNPCRCVKRIRYAKDTGRVDPNHLLFARQVRDEIKKLNELQDAAGLLRSHPHYQVPARLLQLLRSVWQTTQAGRIDGE